MARFVLFAGLSMLIAVPAAAQVINGETPLDETTLNRETPGPADKTRAPVMPPAAAEPARRDPPGAEPQRD